MMFEMRHLKRQNVDIAVFGIKVPKNTYVYTEQKTKIMFNFIAFICG